MRNLLSDINYDFNRSRTNSATSLTWISPPSAFEASVIIAMQNGHPTASVAAPAEGAACSVALASANRVAFTRADPGSSSFHICAPPAPQQNDLAELRGISIVNAPAEFSASRGASVILLCRP